jgi:two-component system response regulator YesN
MYNVLIVDDEVHAVRGLQAGVNWEKLKISAILTAHSMKQAQEVYGNSPVDLMICDIEMPQNTGMDLLAWVREHHPKTETIFLTCHSDFSYAKRAIQLDSFEYLLKPVDYEELEEVMERALAKFNKHKQLQSFEETYNHYYQLWESHQSLMKERFWQDLIQQSIPSIPENIKEHLQKYNLMSLEGMRFVPVLIRVERWYKKLTQRDEQIMEYALRNAAEEGIAQYGPNAAVISLKDGIVLVILPFGPNLQISEIRMGCGEYIRFCNQYLYCDLCCYIGDPVAIHKMVPMLGMLNKLDQENVAVVNEIILLRDVKKTESQIEPPSMSGWAELMKQGAKARLLTEVQQYFHKLKQAGSGVGAPLLHSFYQDLLQMLFFVLQMNGLQANKVFAANLLTEKPEMVLRSVQALEEWVQFVIEVAMNQIHLTDGNMSVVDKVKQYITANISEPGLSREVIANYVYLNPDYLTRVFKKETGLSISDHLQQQRIHYAKELLATTDKTVSDIAVLAGYSNLSYFSTIFKKAVHMNPNEYRKLGK